MTKRLCRCGAIVDGKCARCAPVSTHTKTTAERGYDHAWRRLSERVRIEQPLCERCEQQGKVKAARHVHHVQPIAVAPWLRLERSNLMAVCVECHEELEKERSGHVQAGV